MTQPTDELGVVLVGHGAPALDCPRELIGELMSLEWRKDSGDPHGRVHARAAELDAAIRNWPRRADNDPYKRGLEQVAESLKPRLPTSNFAIGYNEFCRPSIPEAIAHVIGQGARRVLVIPSMLTPGGVHSEIDIPNILDQIRQAHPRVSIEYVWPFALDDIAQLLATHLDRRIQARERRPGGVASGR